jgi:DNA invertase Pin-like site-specific DNA recombinase
MSKNRPPRAFSYIRFSTPQQAEGGSLDRQTRLTAAYCKRKGLTLDESLSLNDFGSSAFREDNVRNGALAGFLEECRLGRVPRGSHLVIESLDRLSRAEIRPALQLFLQLQDYGIWIVTHEPAREYDPDASDALALIEPLIIFARAHEESVMKSHRRRDGWRQARERVQKDGGSLLKTCPAWLEVADGKYHVKEEAAAAVRRVFALARDGLGLYRISARLEAEGVPPIGKGGWGKRYVHKILTGTAATGTHQPMKKDGGRSVPDGPPIPNFYPPIVSEEEWQQARAALRSRAAGGCKDGRFQKGEEGGRVSKAAGRVAEGELNLFTGLLHDAPSGRPMHLARVQRPVRGEKRHYVYLAPVLPTGVPGGRRIDYHAFEHAVLSALLELKPSDVTGKPASADAGAAEVARLSGKLVDLDGRLERTRQRAGSTGDFDAFLDVIQELQAERKRLSERLAELHEEQAGRQPADLGECQSLIDMLAQAPEDQREELRRRLKVRIRQVVAGLWVLIVPRGRARLVAVQLWFSGGKRQRGYVFLHNPLDGSRPGRPPEPLSAAWAAKRGALDLRDQTDARALEAELLDLDLAELDATAPD